MPDDQKIVVKMSNTRPTLRMTRYDIVGGGREVMPNAYVSQEALKKAFGGSPDRIKITIEVDK